MVRILHFGKLFITLVTLLSEVLGSNEEFFCFLGEGFGEGVVTYLAHDELTELGEIGFCAVEVETVLTCFFLFGVEVPEVPVTALNGHLLLVLGATHTDLDTVVDAGSVADDQRRTVVSLSLLDDLEVLSLAGAHSNLCYIYITVALGNHAEVFTFSHVALARHSVQAPFALALRNGLADLLTRGSELGFTL